MKKKYKDMIIKAKIESGRCPRCNARGYDYFLKKGCCWRCALSHGDIEFLTKSK